MLIVNFQAKSIDWTSISQFVKFFNRYAFNTNGLNFVTPYASLVFVLSVFRLSLLTRKNTCDRKFWWPIFVEPTQLYPDNSKDRVRKG